MGVPTFYRWLCCRYPRVVVDVGEGHVEQMREEMRVRKQQRRARRRAAAAELRALRRNNGQSSNRSSGAAVGSSNKEAAHAGKDCAAAPAAAAAKEEEGRRNSEATGEHKDNAETEKVGGDSSAATEGEGEGSSAPARRIEGESAQPAAVVVVVVQGGAAAQTAADDAAVARGGGDSAAAAEGGGDSAAAKGREKNRAAAVAAAAALAETAAAADTKEKEEVKVDIVTEIDQLAKENEKEGTNQEKEELQQQQGTSPSCKVVAEGQKEEHPPSQENEGGLTKEDEQDEAEEDDDDDDELLGYDCLYLDMNGIIHPCCHTDDGGGPATEEEMFLCIFQYIDRIVELIQPRQLLYMAIDGVAPRAKMNQQRSRRFKTAKDIADEEKVYEEMKEQFIREGRDVPPKKIKWDSNVITPGTPFMHRLSVALTYYIQDRIASRDLWKNLKVIFSDATVPGEGEHKIMDFIRQQRKSPSYQPNLWHVLHGADADLIMLGLATHERNFCILREAVVERTSSSPSVSCSTCGGAVGHTAQSCPFNNCNSNSNNSNNNGEGNRGFDEDQQNQQQQQQQPQEGDEDKAKGHMLNQKKHLRDTASEGGVCTAELELHRRSWKPLQMLQLPILREYLQYELITTRGPEAASENLERCIDDFVFLCFLCGNDFLPHLPHQSIQRGSIDALVELYIHLRPHTLTDYLTNEGTVNYAQLEIFLQHLSVIEELVIRKDLLRKVREGDESTPDEIVASAVPPSPTTERRGEAGSPPAAAVSQWQHSFVSKTTNNTLNPAV